MSRTDYWDAIRSIAGIKRISIKRARRYMKYYVRVANKERKERGYSKINWQYIQKHSKKDDTTATESPDFFIDDE